VQEDGDRSDELGVVPEALRRLTGGAPHPGEGGVRPPQPIGDILFNERGLPVGQGRPPGANRCFEGKEERLVSKLLYPGSGGHRIHPLNFGRPGCVLAQGIDLD